LTCKARDAFPRLGEELGIDTPRRLSSCTANENTLAEILARDSQALRDEELARTRAPFHLGQSRMSRQRGMRASLWLRRPLGTCTLSVAYSVNAAMRAADNCHPLPDQLHPCSSFFRFPRTSSCDVVRSRKDRCVFTTPSIASAGGPVFTREKCSFPWAWLPLRVSRFVASLLLPAPRSRVAVGL
jgi:hypothetical protein